jgi:hypothetical protein
VLPNERKALVERIRKQRNAIELLKALPDFPSVQIETHDEVQKLIDDDPSIKTFAPRSEELLNHLIEIFDIRAEALLRLVTDMQTHEAFVDALTEAADWIWAQWSGGWPLSMMPPVNHPMRTQIDRLRPRAQHWSMEGYRKLASLKEAETGDEALGQQRERIDGFIAKVLTHAGVKITRTEIWKVAGYGDATEFERFQRGDERTTESAKVNFGRVLSMEPKAFMEAVKKQSGK